MGPATDPPPQALQQRYAAIEQVYAEQNWPEVEARSRSLLAEISDDPSDPLRQRVILLLAHTQLYGNGDPAGAASLYRAVLSTTAEAVLVKIADEGLARCSPPLVEEIPGGTEEQPTSETSDQAATDLHNTAVMTTAAAAPDQTTPREITGSVQSPGGGSPAMPWLKELTGEQARQPAGIDASLSLAPFQLTPHQLTPPPSQPAGSVDDPATQHQEPSPVRELGSSAEQPSQPLRWPFMADFAVPPPAERLEEIAGTIPSTQALGGSPGESAEGVIEQTWRSDPAAQSTTVLKPEQELEVLEGSGLGLEEIQALSTGLLRVTLTAKPPSAQAQG
jgi:hypothetical protein